MKVFYEADIVKFVPYCTATGVQGGSLKMVEPDYSGYALVINIGGKLVSILMPSGEIIAISKACVETVLTLQDNSDEIT
jgi:Na+/serine symporter